MKPDGGSLRRRLLDRCGAPRHCGWNDDQLLDYIDFGMRTNTPTPPADASVRARRDATMRDLAWALNSHGVDSLVGVPDDILARFVLEQLEGLNRLTVQRRAREAGPLSPRQAFDPYAPKAARTPRGAVERLASAIGIPLICRRIVIEPRERA